LDTLFIAEEVDGTGVKGSGNTITVDIKTHLEAFLNMSLRLKILKIGEEAMILYLARLLDITINNGTIRRDWKKTIAVPIHKGGDPLAAKNYRPVSLTSGVCKPMEHIIAGYIRQVWEDRDW